MTSKEKKQTGIIAVMLLGTILVIYFNFLKPKSAPIAAVQTPGGTVTIPAAGAGVPPAATAGIPTAAKSASVSAFLPAGTNLDLNVLDDKHFKALVAPVYPVVTPDEIGATDPFGQ